MKREQTVSSLLILLVCVFWGLGNPVIKIGSETVPPFTLIAFRFIIAFAVFMLFAGRRIIQQLRVIPLVPCLSVCLFMALAFIFGSFALTFSKATTIGFLMGLAVIFTPLLETLLLKTRFNARILPLIALVCVGMYLLCGGDGAFVFGLGEVLAVLCSICYAMMLTLSEKHMAGMDPITVSAMQCAVAGVLGAVCALIFDGMYDFSRMTWTGAGAVLYIALGSTSLACLLQNKAMRHIPATFASIAFCTEPVFTVLFSYLLLGETMTAQGFIGAGIILGGIILASLQNNGRVARESQITH